MDAMNSVSITGGGYSAQISLLGGQLLNLTHHEDELIVPAAKTEGAFAGAVLAPWPNRTKGGSYTYAGVEHTLAVNEEATGAALHGLLIDVQLNVLSQRESEVQLQGWLEPSEGYPFGLDIALTYRVSADIGLTATLMARYRPEELDEEHVAETEAPPAEPEDAEPETEPDDAEPDESELNDVEADAAVPEDGSPETTDVETTDVEDDDVEATDVEAADVEAIEVEDGDVEDVAGPEAGEAESASTEVDESVSADLGTVQSDSVAADPETPGTDDVSGVEPAPATAPQTAPFGAGFHPYLSAGGASLRECRLRLPARTMLRTKVDGTVTARKPVSQDFDLTNGPLLAGRVIDHAFTDLPEEGWTAELIHGPSGFVVRMIADSPWVQVYTGERIDRAGVAIEPMSCPPNAFNSGEDLIHLVPGKWFRMGYSIEAIRAD